MVVEDYQPLRSSLIEVVQKFGHHALGFESAESFDDEAKDRNLDLIVIDVTCRVKTAFLWPDAYAKCNPL